jgi:hypothetical protein
MMGLSDKVQHGTGSRQTIVMTSKLRGRPAGDTAMQHDHLDSVTPADSFPTDPTGLPEASRPELLELVDGETLELRVAPVASRSATPPCGCWATTAPSQAPPSR